MNTTDKKAWKEENHPRKLNGQFGKGGKTSEIYNRPVTIGHGDKKPTFYPTTNTKFHDKHHIKHAAEMNMNLREWKEAAAELLNRADNKNLFDWKEYDGKLYARYDKMTGYIVYGSDEGEIFTYFKLEKSQWKKYIPQKFIDRLK